MAGGSRRFISAAIPNTYAHTRWERPVIARVYATQRVAISLSGAVQTERGLLDQNENSCWIKMRILPSSVLCASLGGDHGVGLRRSGRRIGLCGSAT